MATIKELTQKIVKFRDEREWKQYHTPKNLAISIAVELGELLEHFQWDTNEEILEKIKDRKVREELEDEIADVAIYIMLLANELNIDLERAILKKLKKNEEKYPVKKFKEGERI